MCAMYGADGKVEKEVHGLSGARRGSVVASRKVWGVWAVLLLAVVVLEA